MYFCYLYSHFEHLANVNMTVYLILVITSLVKTSSILFVCVVLYAHGDEP